MSAKIIRCLKILHINIRGMIVYQQYFGFYVKTVFKLLIVRFNMLFYDKFIRILMLKILLHIQYIFIF